MTFSAKKSALFSRAIILTEFVISKTQYTVYVIINIDGQCKYDRTGIKYGNRLTSEHIFMRPPLILAHRVTIRKVSLYWICEYLEDDCNLFTLCVFYFYE